MDAAERLELIRNRLKGPAIGPRNAPTGLFRATHPDAPRIEVRKPFARLLNPSQRNWNVAGDYCPTSDNRPPWVYRPDMPKPRLCAVKRTKRVSPLIKIAKAWKDQETFAPTLAT